MLKNKQLITLFGLSTFVYGLLLLAPAFLLSSFQFITIQDAYISIFLFCIAVYVQSFSISDMAESWTEVLRQRLFHRYIERNAFDSPNKNAAQISSEIVVNAQQFKELFERNIPIIFNGFFILVSASILMVYFTQTIFFLTLCILPCIMLPQLYFSKHLTTFFINTQANLNRLSEYIFETLSQLKTVQALNHQEIDKLIISQYLARMSGENAQNNHQVRMFFLCYFSCVVAILSAIVFMSRDFISAWNLKVLLTCSYLFVLVVVSLFRLGRVAGDVSKMMTLYQSFYVLDDSEPVAYKKLIQYPAQGLIAVHNVSFAYPSIAHQMVLHDVNVSIYPGEFIALVGPSGAGKTTFLNLIMKFYQTNRGKIYLDGINVNELEPCDLRSQITLVDQEPELFSASVFENILYGNPKASDADVENLLEMIMPEETWQLPKGLRTPVGPRGSGLSIGQKQCIALCRGLLRNTSVFLLDEATSSIDSYSEDLINSNLKFLLQGKTTVMVTHKLAHIEMADRVLMMHSGRIVGFDTHDNLYNNNPLYRKLILLEYNKEAVKQYA